MKNKVYKVYTNSNNMLSFNTSEEVMNFLNRNYGDNSSRLKLIEVYDPVTGWDFANTWLHFRKNKEANYETDFCY